MCLNYFGDPNPGFHPTYTRAERYPANSWVFCWKLWDPAKATEEEEDQINQLRLSGGITSAVLQLGQAAQLVPSWVRTSDAAFGLLLLLGPTHDELHEWYILDFSTNAGPIKAPLRGNFGRAWLTNNKVTRI